MNLIVVVLLTLIGINRAVALTRMPSHRCNCVSSLKQYLNECASGKETILWLLLKECALSDYNSWFEQEGIDELIADLELFSSGMKSFYHSNRKGLERDVNQHNDGINRIKRQLPRIPIVSDIADTIRAGLSTGFDSFGNAMGGYGYRASGTLTQMPVNSNAVTRRRR